jgi:hypothetical protein
VFLEVTQGLNTEYLKSIFEPELQKLAGTYLASERTELSRESEGEDVASPRARHKDDLEAMFYLQVKISHNYSYFLIHEDGIFSSNHHQSNNDQSSVMSEQEEHIDLNDYNASAFQVNSDKDVAKFELYALEVRPEEMNPEIYLYFTRYIENVD